MINDCTRYPGFRIYGNKSEDTKFFIQVCQSIGVPFLMEDSYLKIKKCGFRDKEHIKKLKIIKDLFENHYIEQWHNEKEVNEWKNSTYPKNVDEQPIFSLDSKYSHYENMFCNGFILDSYTGSNYSDLEYCYVPGTSTFLGGQGIVITKKSKHKDEAFEFLELFLNSTYPFTTNINVAVTPS